jgi:DNA-binding transcriptional regulator YiaG
MKQIKKPDPESTLRELRDCLAVTYESHHKIAARIGVTVKTFADWLTGDRQPMGKSLSKLPAFFRCRGQTECR